MAPEQSRPMTSSISPLGAVDVRGRQVDLVEDRDDVEVVVERQKYVGEGLRLNALGCVHDEERALRTPIGCATLRS